MTPFITVEQLLDEAASVATRYVPGIDSTISNLRDQATAGRVTVMLYGAYNAGKSTLINALLGREDAAVGDVPTTDNVTAYDWDGHVLLDTPGVNAPIEHEEVSLARLKETDLVLFVLRQEDQDADDVLRRIFDLLDNRHPVFLVLNVSDSDTDHVEHARGRLDATLLNYARSRTPAYTVDDLAKIPLAIMNSHSALRARLDGKALLRERAGFDQFMAQFTAWLQGHEDVQARLASVQANIDRALIQPVTAAMHAVEPADAEAEEAVQARSDYARATAYLKQAARTKVRHEVDTRRGALSKALSQDDAQAGIVQVSTMSHDIVQAVETWMHHEAGGGLLGDLAVRLTVGEIDIGNAPQADSSRFVRTGRDTLITSAKSGATPENLAAVLKYGRKLKIPGLKGRWEKTLGKFAGKAAPWIQVGLAVAEVGAAHYDETSENKTKLGQALEHSQRVNDVCMQIQADIVEGIETQLTAHFDELVAPVDARIEAIRSEAGSRQADRLAWASLADRLEALRF